MTHRTVGHPAGLPDEPYANIGVPNPACPVEITLAALHGRWTTLVVRELLRGDRSYSELRAALPTLSDKVLSDRLAQLGEAGVVETGRVCRTPGRTPRLRPLPLLPLRGTHGRHRGVRSVGEGGEEEGGEEGDPG
ncbi:helix-turn-helix domain-containing protein [Streptomyces sp. NPDC005989]|uniref:winged helix-turn-helix transcriptional regulator n=1 Tax=Streptomyces sp. NPDC005989 TaxID=3156727 RepID=UPI0033FCB662